MTILDLILYLILCIKMVKWESMTNNCRNWQRSLFILISEYKIYFSKIKILPMRGVAAPYWKCDCSRSWALLSCSSPSRSFSRTAWGTLHPHPFRSQNFVSRKLGSNPLHTGSNGRGRICKAKFSLFAMVST